MKDFLERHLAHPGIKRSIFLRRSLAVSLIVLGICLQLARTSQSEVEVLAFAHDIQPGATITTDDVTTIHLPPEAVPSGAINSADDVIGSVTASAQTEGSVITTFSTASAELLSLVVSKNTINIQSEPLHYVPIKLADPTIANLLRQGDTVTIISTSPESGKKETIAAGGTVIFTTKTDTETSGSSPGTVMLSLPKTDAETVAARSLSSPLTVVVTGN